MDLKQEIVNILLEAKDEIISNIETEGIRASGKTQKSLKIVEYDKGVRLVGGGGDAAPISTLQYGRKSGKVPLNFREIIVKWLEDKNISTTPLPYKRQLSERWQPKFSSIEERGKYQAAYFIAKKIKNKGTDRFVNNNLNIYTPVQKEVKGKIEKIFLAKINEMLK